MAMAQRQLRPQQTYLAQQGQGRGGPSGLADVLEVLLDNGLVIDAFVRVSLIGIELLTIDARVVVASVDTYLRFAEAVNRLDLLQVNNSQNLGDLVGGGSSGGGSSEQGSSPALSSRSSKPDLSPAFEEEDSSEDEKERSEPAATDESPSSHDESDDEGNGSHDDKGILTRIKERGQVF